MVALPLSMAGVTWSASWLALLQQEWPALPVGILLLVGIRFILAQPIFDLVSFLRRLALLAFVLRLAAGLVVLLVFSGLVRGGDSGLYYRSTALLVHQFQLDFQQGSLIWWYGWSDSAINPAQTLPIEYPPNFRILCNETAYWVDSEAFTVVRILTLLWLPAGGSMLALVFLGAGLSFWGIWLFFVEIVRADPRTSSAAAVVLFLLPGVVLWSSGLLKEPWAFGAHCAMIGLWLRGIRLRRIINFIWAILPMGLLFLLRPPVLFIFAFGMALASLWYVVRAHRFLRLGLVLACCLAGVVLLTRAGDSIRHHLSELEYYRWYALHFGHHPSIPIKDTSGFDIGKPKSDWSEALRWGRATGAALFQPLPWSVRRWIEWPLALENLLVFLWIVYSFMYMDYKRITDTMNRHPWLAVLMGCSVVWLLVLGLSTPFSGSLWRYRIHAVPFLLLGLVALLRPRHPMQRFRLSTAGDCVG